MGPVKSPYDPKEYRTIRLENGIVALLISDTRNSPQRRSPVRCHRRHHNVSTCSDVEGGAGKRKGKGMEGKEDEEEESDIESSSGSEYESDDDTCSGTDEEEEEGGKGKKAGADRNSPLRSACAVCVNAGSFSDPSDIPGLAHLLEHMVFMGSKKYPGENTFDVFTNRHGGFDNASTDYEKTVFEFCIHRPYFKEALDMFAQFFAFPVLEESSLDREIEAVDSEFQMSIQDDTDRIQQLLCSIANPDHPFAKFVWGNSESLRKMPKKKKLNLGRRLREFYQRAYSSHYMTVAVISCDSLDSLEEWVRESFSAVPHNQLPPPTFKDLPPVFDEAKFHRLYKVVPVKDTHEVQLTWELPCLFDQYRVKPLHYVGWLLGHEGKGSVLSLLKKKNLATSLCAGNSGLGYEYNSCFSLFMCTLTLTDKGFEAIAECIRVIFQYLKLLREVGPRERIYKEIQIAEQNEFNFKEEDSPVDYVEALCESMQYYPEEDYLTGDDLMFEYNPKVISSVQDLLTPERVNIMLISRRFADECHEKERWFGTKFSSTEIPLEMRKDWDELELNPELKIPLPNVFIATDFSLKKEDAPMTKYPVVVDECSRYKLWFKKDAVFSCPRAWICLLFKTPLHLQTAENAVLMDLYLMLLAINSAEVTYAAEVAQLVFSTGVTTRGITLTFSGLNHKLPLLFENSVDSIASFSTTEENFSMVKEQVKRHYENYTSKAKKLCKISRLKVLERHHFGTMEKMAVVDGLQLASLVDFTEKLREELSVEALVQGNMTAKDAKGLMSYLCSHLEFSPLPKSSVIKPETVQLPSNTHVNYQQMNRNHHSPNTVITHYYQCSPKTIRDTTMSSLLAGSMEEPCFDTLRTKQQLGYEVYTTHHLTHGVVGISLTLVTQGTKHSVEYASDCMDKFMQEFVETVYSWSPEEFQSQVDASIHEKLQPDISLEEEATRNWGEVISGGYHFDQLEREVEELRTITQEEACDWLQKYTRPGNHYRKLSVEVVSHSTGAENLTNQSDMSQVPDGTPQESSVDAPVIPTHIELTESSIESFKQTLPVFSSSCCDASKH